MLQPPDPAVLDRVAHALADVPRAAYSVPHVYPTAAPAYVSAPEAERPAPGASVRLYVHVPFCRYHCSFCSFAVRVGADAAAMERYVAAVERELVGVPEGTPLDQLYVGGGTPTHLPPELLDRLLGAVFARAPGREGAVHTVETSPETVSAAHLEVLARHGVGRVSMGIQSFDDGVLATVHRKQARSPALAALELLAASGRFFNVDLIYGLPGQTPASFGNDLRRLAALGVPSLTLYSLRRNERTRVSAALGDEGPFDLAGLMAWRAYVERAAADAGYVQTRWHTWKRLDGAARANEMVDLFDDKIAGRTYGVGMSARSHLGHTIYRNHEELPAYLERVERGASPVEQTMALDGEDQRTQLVARTIGDGKRLRRAAYRRTFGTEVDDDFRDVLTRLAPAGLLTDDGDHLALSDLGRQVYDLVTLAFYPRRARDWLIAREGRASFLRAAP